MCDYKPCSNIDSIAFADGKCLITHSQESALLIIHPQDVCHIGFMLYRGRQSVSRRINEKSILLSVPPDIMAQIKALAPKN
ncbi:MAG: hypothetical protein WCS88_04315 [Patescibacteria group bacterium]|jgi:hypothetical protein